MSTDTTTGSRWRVPALCLGFGLVYLMIGAVKQDWTLGIGGLAIMLAYGALLVIFGRRNEAVGMLGDSFPDERRRELQRRTAASTGYVLVLVLVAGSLITMVTDSPDAGPFAGLTALAGATWIGFTIWHVRRG
ncbi:MAG TPA: hypothetical protein VHO01_16250 [Jatrophihabitans sp.]|nr:hypothetical protein [Jatrophihabitans sp.]